MNNFILRVNTPQGLLFEEKIYSIKLDTDVGQITILSNHTPIIGILKTGYTKIINNSLLETTAVLFSGIFCFKDNALDIITEYFEFYNKNKKTDIYSFRKNIIEAIKKNKITNETNDQLVIEIEKKLEDISKLTNEI